MSLRFVSAAADVSRETPGILGGARLGGGPLDDDRAWPMQAIPAPLLASTAGTIEEYWLATGQLRSGEANGLRWQRNDEVLFGVITLNEADFAEAAKAAGKTALQLASEAAYTRIFELIDREGLPKLWRIWNYLADINQEVGEANGLERYRQFNIGRQDAFLASQRCATGNVPAACAIGLRSGPLSIAFLAGATAPVPVENPRQVSAYHYPATYGPRSPTFSRGALVYPAGQEILFISGTASIVGHQTVHPADPQRQCRETMENIAAVIREANRLCRSTPFAVPDMHYRVYVRQARDLDAIRQSLLPLIGQAPVIYVEADICRADLLLEIEAMASHPLEERS